MTKERLQGTLEDIQEIESIGEFEAYVKILEECECDEESGSILAAAMFAKRDELEGDPVKVLAQYVIELGELQKEEPKAPPVAKQSVPRTGRSYRLLKDSVDWSTTPQVHAIMEILKSFMKVGDVATEEDIVAAMEANREVLATRQTGRRIWDFYKGKSDKGLMTHGNIELA